MDEGMDAQAIDEAPARPRRHIVAVAAVLVAVALAGIWPALWTQANDGAEALLGAGIVGPSALLIADELPGAPAFDGLGHDGQQFYAIARHPFDPAAARSQLDSPAYRYRRILFPALGAALAPGGGRPLVVALLGVSLAGVALGAWAVSRLPDAPGWLPLAVGLTPGVGVALALTLSDALGTGLALAAVAASMRRRWTLMVLALVAAVLTRESLILVAVGLLWTPDVPTRWRIGTVVAPLATAGAWALWSANALGTPALDGSGQLGLPLVGWLASDGSPPGQVLGLLSMLILGVGAWRSGHRAPGVRVVLGLHTLLMACLAVDVTTSWVNTTRVAAPVLALAVWAIVRPDPLEASRAATGEARAEPASAAGPIDTTRLVAP